MTEFHRQNRYSDRPVAFRGVHDPNGWSLKLYDIAATGKSVREASFQDGVSLAMDLLPDPAITSDRPGLGIVIRHAGAADYIILAWWDNQNELLTRTLVRAASGDRPWLESGQKHSFCVWDLQVLWHERNAFVSHILSPPDAPDFQSYLDCPL